MIKELRQMITSILKNIVKELKTKFASNSSELLLYSNEK